MKKSSSTKSTCFLDFLKKHKRIILLSLLAIIFFSFSVILTYDSGHYLGYVSILEDKTPASEWDIVRGPVFPLIIHLSNLLFGRTSTGFLICLFIFYISYSLICYIIIKTTIDKNSKRSKIAKACLLSFVLLNPLIFGYFHVMLTEFVSITITMLSILIAYRWIFVDINNRKKTVLYAAYFIISTVFCWHLKQSYLIVTIAPLIISAIIAIANNRKKANVIYRSVTIFTSIIFLFLSIVAWNGILDLAHVNKNTNRDTSSLLSTQLLKVYDIPSEKEDNASVSVKDAVFAVVGEFFSNPGKVTSTYLKNYCGLISLCVITTEDSVDYIATSKLDLIHTYENTSIGYATFNRPDNIFSMKEEMFARASSYSAPISKTPITKVMRLLSDPTNIIFKISTLLCLPFFIILMIVHCKNKNKIKVDKKVYYLSVLLLGTASCHLLFNTAVGLFIDRYAIEAFIPSTLGITGAIIYINTIRNANRDLKQIGTKAQNTTKAKQTKKR